MSTSTLEGFSFFFLTGFSSSAAVLSPNNSFSFVSTTCCNICRYDQYDNKMQNTYTSKHNVLTHLKTIKWRTEKLPSQSLDQPMAVSLEHVEISHQLIREYNRNVSS